MKFFGLLILGTILNISAYAQNIVLSELKAADIKGCLGVPLHTVCKIDAKVVDMSFTKKLADQGRLGFQILAVDDKPINEKVFVDIPGEIPEGITGKDYVLKIWVYETVTSSGYPSEAFTKLDIPAFKTVGLHLRSKLVFLKFAE